MAQLAVSGDNLQLFSDPSKPTMNISKGSVRFNIMCMKKFENVEYVELLLNSVEKCIAIRPCEKNNPNAIQWGKLKDSKWIITPRSCSGFAEPLYNLMKWSMDCGYKLSGQYIKKGDEQLLLFDLSEPIITQYEKQPKNNEEIGESVDTDPMEYVYQRKVIYPEKWFQSTDYIFLKEKQYGGNWSIMQPTSVFRFCGNVTEQTMQKMNEEMEELLYSFQNQQMEGSI